MRFLNDKRAFTANGSRLCFVAEKQAKKLYLKTKLTNTNRISS